MSGWIDFKELRSQLDFEQVLRHYGVEVKRKGHQHHGYCPLPNHNGKRNSPSFSAHLGRGIFQCVGCGAKGNLLEFACLMSNSDPKDGDAFRKVAKELQERFCPANGNPPEKKKPGKKLSEPPSKEVVTKIINALLDFELKGLDANHPYLKGRGFSAETIALFGLGFCSRGMLKDRIAIPLHNDRARLVGYAGRVVDDTTINEDNPRYRFPGEHKREGKTFGFRKTLFLYNGFRIKPPVDDLIVVEGFTSVWWLHQNSITNVVATMGSDCSEKQAALIVSLVKPNGRVWTIPDGDDAGERFVESVLLQVSPYRFVRWVRLESGKQPTDLQGEALAELVR